jgi:N2-acetyl-L-2,4-diaminobutanoate deacetylase
MQTLVSRIDFDTLAPHSRKLFDLCAYVRPDGNPCTIPVHVLTGARMRPRVVVVAGVHGDEPDGIVALLDASRRLSCCHLQGQVILVPIANPPAFSAGQRRSPIDDTDLNRSFPGSSTGTSTEKTAHCLFEHVVRGADFVFTLHSWYATGTVLPFVEVPAGSSDVARRSLAAARASGFEKIRLTDWPAGLLVPAANTIGVPGMEAELGDSGMARPVNQEQYIRHLMALLGHLEVLEQPPINNLPASRFYHGQHVRSDFAGVLRMLSLLGETVVAGQIVAEVADLHGELIGPIRSPVSGTIVSRRSYASVVVGDIVATIFSIANAPDLRPDEPQ